MEQKKSWIGGPIFEVIKFTFYSLKIRLETPEINILIVALLSQASLVVQCMLTSVPSKVVNYHLVAPDVL